MKTKTTKQLIHIDNNFYHLTPAQAKALSVDNSLPAHGYQKRADNSKLAQFQFGKLESYPTATKPDNRRFREFESVIRDDTRAWIQRTPLSWFSGQPVKAGYVWAVHVFNS